MIVRFCALYMVNLNIHVRLEYLDREYYVVHMLKTKCRWKFVSRQWESLIERCAYTLVRSLLVTIFHRFSTVVFISTESEHCFIKLFSKWNFQFSPIIYDICDNWERLCYSFLLLLFMMETWFVQSQHHWRKRWENITLVSWLLPR